MKDRLGYSLREATVADDEAVTTLMAAYLDWACRVLFDDYGIDQPPADPSGIRESLEGLRRPNAMILLAEQGDRAVGVGAVRGLGTGIVEIKRMYVDPSARGLHVGSAILDRLLDEARESGAEVVRLDTCVFMTEAQRLYRSREFRERSPYAGTEIPEHLQQYWRFFERTLT